MFDATVAATRRAGKRPGGTALPDGNRVSVSGERESIYDRRFNFSLRARKVKATGNPAKDCASRIRPSRKRL
jgi:hypothetical protein